MVAVIPVVSVTALGVCLRCGRLLVLRIEDQRGIDPRPGAWREVGARCPEDGQSYHLVEGSVVMLFGPAVA